jgi:protein MpaA
MALAGCTSVSSGDGPVTQPEAPPTTVAPAAAPSVAATSTTDSASTTPLSASTAAASTVAVSTVPATTAAPSDFLGEEIIGTSAGGRPIAARHRGTPGGTVVLVVGVIHGNEDAGLAVLDLLDTLPVPAGVDLWLLPAMNPDGLALQQRGNANGVDLNRNFPHDWTPIAKPGEWQYSGTGPASEPETQAFTAFADRIRPALTLWYHQDLFRISPSKGADRELRARYAALTGLPLETVTGGIYTGVAATWVRTTVPDAMSFIIELGPTLSPDEALVHAVAVLDVATMVQALRK